jgi:hypothetical protein
MTSTRGRREGVRLRRNLYAKSRAGERKDFAENAWPTATLESWITGLGQCRINGLHTARMGASIEARESL